ncbi:MAG TPA: SAF domain-containing protein [Acidimicrobiia bacterium]|nr:SAF domain-containing protein [Acidimicrobiia bacterium]
MLWLERPPIIRWVAAGCLVAVAAWSELAPPPTTSMAFLVSDVAAGTRLGPEHVEYRTVPAAPIQTIEPRGVAAADLKEGDPLVASMVTEPVIPSGWLLIEAPVPAHVGPGSAATGIILGESSAPVEFDARVLEAGGEDAFGSQVGVVAVPPEWVGAAAAAAAENRLVIGVETAGR